MHLTQKLRNYFTYKIIDSVLNVFSTLAQCSVGTRQICLNSKSPPSNQEHANTHTECEGQPCTLVTDFLSHSSNFEFLPSVRSRTPSLLLSALL